MNYCVITGKIEGDIISELDREISCTKFNLKNLYYKPNVSATEKTIIRCICYGAVADYVNNELYEGAQIIVTGRILSRHYITNGVHIDRMYVGCNTVSLLEQEEYN